MRFVTIFSRQSTNFYATTLLLFTETQKISKNIGVAVGFEPTSPTYLSDSTKPSYWCCKFNMCTVTNPAIRHENADISLQLDNGCNVTNVALLFGNL